MHSAAIGCSLMTSPKNIITTHIHIMPKMIHKNAEEMQQFVAFSNALFPFTFDNLLEVEVDRIYAGDVLIIPKLSTSFPIIKKLF